MKKFYEVRFGIDSKKRIQEYRIYTTQAESYAEALKNFVEWANNGEEKFDMKNKPYRFRDYPVTEQNATSVCRLSF